MKNIIKPILGLAFLFCTTIAFSQSSFSITYNYGSIGSADLGDFITKDNWRGFQFEYQYYMNDNATVGFLTGYHGFYEKRARDVYDYEGGSVSAVTWRYFENIPIMATGKYYFANGRVRPYVGGGAGFSIATQELQVADLLNSKNRFSFTVLGEAGLLFAINDNWGILANGKYTYGFMDNSSEFNTKNFGYWNGGLGVTFRVN